MPAFEQDLCLCFVYKNSLIAEHLFSFACIVYEKNMFYFDWFISRHVVKFFSFFLFFFLLLLIGRQIFQVGWLDIFMLDKAFYQISVIREHRNIEII